MNATEVHLFEKTQSQLEGLLTEVTILAKKSPNDGVNKFKLKFINEIIVNGNKVLGKTYKPLDSFEKFDEDDLPSNSDITFILSQYLNCFEKKRADNIYREQKYDGNKYFYEWYWSIDKSKSKIKTAPPKKIK
ncbi:hypothetical protein SAMN04487765_3237 [Tenacibaculum sp. MAR_2010_89]|uniref:hypothetical protein n=1 Tax=Tenacibaculum sp. MAR_2010_89 TaxID=1250198 RepID=UPI00089647ED|nr:hypothetical protein [Tenacibaculum sp. MAR_2010_89]SEE58230.1 hypothetical protein SAMN04487765_3237 [Tenacibaculum sp. MAR_2010_89]